MDQLRTLEFVQLQAFARVLQKQNKKFVERRERSVFFTFFLQISNDGGEVSSTEPSNSSGSTFIRIDQSKSSIDDEPASNGLV